MVMMMMIIVIMMLVVLMIFMIMIDFGKSDLDIAEDGRETLEIKEFEQAYIYFLNLLITPWWSIYANIWMIITTVINTIMGRLSHINNIKS